MDETDATTFPLAMGTRETVIPDVPGEWSDDLAAARLVDGVDRHDALKSVAAAHPLFLAAWAELAEQAAADGDMVTSYAFARVGYHRGLDSLRGAGWKGSGRVQSRHESNLGFLRSLAALRDSAAAIGEDEEADRCEAFLAELDPDGADSR